MAKQRKKNKKSSSGRNGVAAMDISSPSPSQASTAVAPPRPQAMDTSERPTAGAMFGAEKLSPLGVSGSGSKKINKISQKRRAVKLRKEKAMEKALSTSEKRRQKLQQDVHKAQRVQSLKKLY